jgi:hypothetical protein
LWQYDCAEVFLHDPASGQYLECNLAPDGAWWTCLFGAPRRRLEVENLPLAGVEARGAAGGAAWEASLRIPLHALPASLATARARASLRGNVTFCLGAEPAQRFCSFAPPAPGAPDFHRPELWLPLARR